MRFIFSPVTFMLMVLMLSTSLKAQSEAPDVLLQRVTQEMISALRQDDKTLKENPTKIYPIIYRILVPHVEWMAMSRWVVGRNAWDNASDAQRQRFSKEFKDLLVRTYASTLRAYNNQTIEYLPIRGGFAGKSRIQVNSLIREPGREAIKVTYKLVNQNNQWLVYDISIEGVSLLKGFQSQFAQEIQQKGIGAVIDRLHQHNEKPLR
ncbi:MAG: ABC transporter substrate-binding protein [Proteobacteria bacterium]|nr:ABC transporter substrate-binding protein [Pseudomonadota bacterium]